MDGKADHRADTQANAPEHAGVEQLSLVQNHITEPHGQQVIPERKEGGAAQADGNSFVVAIGSEAVAEAYGHNPPVNVELLESQGYRQREPEAAGKLEQDQSPLRIHVHERFHYQGGDQICRRDTEQDRHNPGHRTPRRSSSSSRQPYP